MVRITKFPWLRMSRQRGQSLVELALVVPIFLLIVMATVDFGWALRNYIVTTNAAREGARYAVTLDTSVDPRQAIRDRTVNRAADILTTADVKICIKGPQKTWCDAGLTASDHTAIVQTTSEYKYITPVGGLIKLLTGGSLSDRIKMKSHTAMYVE